MTKMYVACYFTFQFVLISNSSIHFHLVRLFLHFCRLEAYDRNSNFANVADAVECESAFDWPCFEFQTLQQCHHSLYARMTAANVNSYFHFLHAADKLSEHNLQSLNKGQLLLNGGRVEVCSAAVLPATSDVYVSGMV